MNSIDILMDEHNNIKRLLKIVRCICIDIVDGKDFDIEDFTSIIDFIRNYADKHHHGREEEILFKYMQEELSSDIGEGPVRGMFIEHDYARSFVINLEMAIKEYKKGNKDSRVDIIANAIGYSNLLSNHILKEDNVIYKYALTHLSDETIKKMDKEFDALEKDQEYTEERQKYLNLIDKLSKKYSC